MRTILLLTAMMLSMTATAQISVSRIKRQLETSDPKEHQLNLRRGETVDFDLQFLSYGTVMDISGSTVTLHATTNGMATGTSFQISGTAGSNGTASVRISVDDWLPYQMTTGTWTLECALPTASRIMRASGVLKLSGLYYPSTNSPLPLTWSTNFWTAISAIQSRTNDWNTAFGWGDHAAAGYLASSAWLSWLSTNQYVQVERDAIALAALSTNKTLRLFDPADVNRYIDGAGNKYVISNFWEMTLPAEIMNGTYYPAPASSNYIFTGYAVYNDYFGSGFSNGTWTFEWSEAGGFLVGVFQYLSGSQWQATTNQYVLSVYGTPELGNVYIRPYSTTNLVGTLATDSSVSSAISTHSTNANVHANLIASLPSYASVTNIVDAVKELHVDSYTNIIWRSVYSNGWMWLVAYTNYPAQ